MHATPASVNPATRNLPSPCVRSPQSGGLDAVSNRPEGLDGDGHQEEAEPDECCLCNELDYPILGGSLGNWAHSKSWT